MARRPPNIDAYHTINGITEDHIVGLQIRLLDTGLFEEADIMGVFRKNNRLQATVIARREVSRLYEVMDRQPTTFQMDELSQYIGQAMPIIDPDSPPSPLVDTLPARVCQPSPKNAPNNRVLLIAGSKPVAIERVLAQQAMRNFFDLRDFPERIWTENDFVTHPHLARSTTEVGGVMLDHLSNLINTEPHLLPANLHREPITLTATSH